MDFSWIFPLEFGSFVLSSDGGGTSRWTQNCLTFYKDPLQKVYLALRRLYQTITAAPVWYKLRRFYYDMRLSPSVTNVTTH